MTRVTAMVPALVLAACAGTPSERPREGEPIMTAATTTTSCEDAREAIRKGRFVGWQGLPRGCAPTAVFGVEPMQAPTTFAQITK